jgi:hypothetical protein
VFAWRRLRMTLHERVGKMTDDQINKFLTLLMGECWHEWVESDPLAGKNIIPYCKHCNKSSMFPWVKNPDHLSNPLPVIRWVEKEMPEVLEGYAEDLWFKRLWDTNMQMIMAFLDLRNLVQYLKEHTEAPFMWGFTPCPSFPSCMSGETDKCDFPDKGCEGDGKVRGHIHPALKYLRSIKEVRDEK